MRLPFLSVGETIVALDSRADVSVAVRNSGSILLESVPLGVNINDVQHDLEMVNTCFGTCPAIEFNTNQSMSDP